MEFIAAILGLLFLVWICSGSGSKKNERYKIQKTGDERYCEVIDTYDNKTVFVGTDKACEQWINDQNGTQ